MNSTINVININGKYVLLILYGHKPLFLMNSSQQVIILASDTLDLERVTVLASEPQLQVFVRVLFQYLCLQSGYRQKPANARH